MSNKARTIEITHAEWKAIIGAWVDMESMHEDLEPGDVGYAEHQRDIRALKRLQDKWEVAK